METELLMLSQLELGQLYFHIQIPTSSNLLHCLGEFQIVKKKKKNLIFFPLLTVLEDAIQFV